jgi:hypothetical protein
VKSRRPTHHSLHWVLDMIFRDDECRVRTDHAPANCTAIKHIAHIYCEPHRARTRCACAASSLLGTMTSSQILSLDKRSPDSPEPCFRTLRNISCPARPTGAAIIVF